MVTLFQSFTRDAILAEAISHRRSTIGGEEGSQGSELGLSTRLLRNPLSAISSRARNSQIPPLHIAGSLAGDGRTFLEHGDG